MEMTTTDFKDVLAGVQSLATVVSFIIGGIWVYRRYIRQQESFAHVESSADVVLLGEHNDYWLVELAGVLENKGKVEHRIEKFEFDVNVLTGSDRLEVSAKFGNQAYFPHCILSGSLLPAKFKNFFIAPGVKARYSYIARIPKNAVFLMFHCWFEYVDRPHSGHAAEKTVNLAALAKVLK